MNLSPYVALAPAVLAVIKVLLAAYSTRERLSATMHRARRHAELLAAVPDGVDSDNLRKVLKEELDAIASDSEAKLYRVIDWGTVATIIIVGIVGGGLGLLAWWGGGLLEGWLLYGLRGLALIVGLTSLLLILVGGLTQLTQDSRTVTDESK